MRGSKWWVLLSVGTGTFMSALDMSVVNTALPVIQRDFGAEIAGIEWVVTIYLLVVSAFLLTFGRLGDLRGHKPIYVLGFAVFLAASILCGFAPSSAALVGARALQAVGGAMIFAMGPAILTQSFPPQERGRALGMQATMTYLGLAVGPAAGGWLVEHFGWRAVFFVNVPIGLVPTLVGTRAIPSAEAKSEAARFDIAGAILFFVGLAAVLVAFNEAHAWGWSSAKTLGLLFVGLAAIGAFARVELVSKHPMLDLSLFRSFTLSTSVASALLNYIGIYSIAFLLPYYLIRARGFSPSEAGVIFTAQPLVMAVVAPISGALSDKVGARLPATLGMVLFSAGLFGLAAQGEAAPTSHVQIALAVAGLGTGLFISPNNAAMLGAAPPHRRGIASGVLAMSRNLGMVLGVGLAGAILTTTMDHEPGARGMFLGISRGLAAGGVCAMGAAIVSALQPSVPRAPERT